MTMKIHVLHQGMVYRVRGIKVLCSVVLAVIILLVVIVCMGAWMLVTAYSNEPILVAANATHSNTYQNVHTNAAQSPETVAKYKPKNLDASIASKFTPEKAKITPKSEGPLIKKEPRGMVETELPMNNSGHALEPPNRNLLLDRNSIAVTADPNNYDDDLPPVVFPVPADSKRKKHFVYDEVFSWQPKPIPFRVTEYDPIVSTHTDHPLLKESYLESAKKRIQQVNNQTPKVIIKKGNKPFDLEYAGPPVVGYGKNPYDKLPPQRIEEFDKVWETFTTPKSDMGDSYSKINKRKGYPKIRLNPPRISRLGQRTKKRKPLNRPFLRPSSIIPLRRPSDRKRLATKLTPPGSNPNRKLMVNRMPGLNSKRQKGRPFRRLQKYSRKLSSSLLEFSTQDKLTTKNATDTFTNRGLNLIREYNKLFDFANRTSKNTHSKMPKTETLKSYSPIEQSLISWTYVDYWEYLIKRVASLSRKPLTGVKRRLENLRQSKDIAMTWSVINQTIDIISTKERKNSPKQTDIISSLPVMPRGLLKNDSQDVSIAKSAINVLKGIFSTVYKKSKKKPDNTTTVELTSNGNTFEEQPLSLRYTSLSSVEKKISTRDSVEGVKREANFTRYASIVIYNYGKVFMKGDSNTDCTMLIFCQNLNTNAQLPGMDGIPAKLKSVGLKVLSEKELRHSDTIGEIFRAVTSWKPMQCDTMFPKCDGERALEIVNEVAHGTN